MITQTQDDAPDDSKIIPKVPRVNLLDPTVEPTDDELDALMRDFLRVVKEREKACSLALQENLEQCIQDSQSLWAGKANVRRSS